jgi:integrase
MPKLTKRYIESLDADGGREIVIWDDVLPGFGLRVKPSGRRTYIVQYRNRQGRSRRLTVGVHGRLTPDEARRDARQFLAQSDRGGDPVEERLVERRAVTMAELCMRYLEDYAALHKKRSSAEMDQRMIERFIVPSLGKRKIADVSRADIIKLHRSIRETPYMANRVLSLVSKMMNLAERWDLRPDGSNPTKHVEKFTEEKRERYLSLAELGRLGDVLAEAVLDGSEPQSAIAAIKLLIFTGCRRDEILTLRWDENVDFVGQCLRLQESKTGAKIVHLGAPALETLQGIERVEGNPHVIIGKKPGTRLINLRKPWRRITKKAGLDDVRIHDLRHTFASIGAGAGLSLPIIGKMLGHTQARTTQRYAHLSADPIKQATETVSKSIVAAMRGDKGEVVPMHGDHTGK